MTKRLSKAYVDTLPFTSERGKQVFYYDPDLKGFGLRVGNAVKTYFAEAKVHRKTVRVSIGRHGVFTAEQARKTAKEKLADMARNLNPSQLVREKQLRMITLRRVYHEYMAARDSLKPNTQRDYKSCAETSLREWLDKPIRLITRDMVEQRHRELSKRSKARANLAMRFLRALFNFAAEYRDSEGQSIITDNPVRRLSAKKIWNRVERRDSYIKPYQLKGWWQAVWSLKIDIRDKTTYHRESIRDYLLLLLFTGLRREEALSLTWGAIDFAEKTITIKDTKNRTDHILPLTNFLYNLLHKRKQESDSQWVFTGSGKASRIIEPRRQILKIAKESGVQFTSHDLRRTFASIVNMFGDRFSYYTVKRLLNHKTTDITAGYVQHDMGKLREAMQAVTDFILERVKESVND